ncbi:MAG: hypothetical protein L0H24_01635, partial [Microlunatus sp.]|nr:hypothetical protein [Microlunatus sp.]
YVPVDEDHPMTNADPYGLSKEVDERTAAMMARRYAMSVAALRFHWIASRSEQLAAIEQQQGIRDWDHELRNLWGYVDVRDAARACRLAIETAKAEPYGFVALNVVAGDSLATAPVTDLIAEHAPDIEVRSPLGSRQGAYAIDRALEVIGWSPQHSWRAPTNFLETRVASDREPGGFMDTSPTPPDDVADADWMEQNSPADPADDIDLDATPTVRVRRSTVEADEADLADQSAAVPLDDDE